MAQPFIIIRWLRDFWHDPLPPHLATEFSRDMAAYFWTVVVGGPVFLIITVWISLAVGSLPALVACGVSAVGFVVAAWACRSALAVTDQATAQRVEDTFRLGSLLSTAGTGSLVLAIMLANPAEEWQRLIIMLSLAVLGLTNGTSIGRPWLLASHGAMIVAPTAIAITLVWPGWSGVLAVGGVTAYGLLSLAISRRAYHIQISLLMARHEQQAERLRLALALDEMPYAVAILDRRRRGLVLNRQIRSLLGVTTTDGPRPFMEMLLSAPNLMLLPENRAEFEEFIKHMGDTARRFSANMRLKDGRLIAVEALPMTNDGWVVVMRDITGQQAELDELSNQARRDPLTGMANRRAFMQALETRCATQSEQPFALLLLDLDGFKAVNDRHGHPMGDRVINRVGYRLRTVSTDLFVARLGGDEFAVLANVADLAAATNIGQQLINAVERPAQFGEVTVQVGAAVGIALAPQHAGTSEALLRAADLAMLTAKADPGSQLRHFTPLLASAAAARTDREMRVQALLRSGQVAVAYQPIVALADGAVVGVEALVRWPADMAPVVDSAELVAIAEARGITTHLRRAVLAQAVSVMAELDDALGLWLNVSALDLRQPKLVEELLATLAGAGLSPQRLTLEITETALMRDEQIGLANLVQLRALGVKVVMDDFGAGFSSLTRLQSLPLDAVKISGTLLTGKADDAPARIVFSAAVRLCHDLGLAVVAEGVEAQGDLAMAIAGGITLVQGFALARPVPAAALPAAIAEAQLQWAALQAPPGSESRARLAAR